MAEKRITIRIGKGGKSFKATTSGCAGTQCQEAVAPLQKLIGGDVQQIETDEMYKKAEEQVNEQA